MHFNFRASAALMLLKDAAAPLLVPVTLQTNVWLLACPLEAVLYNIYITRVFSIFFTGQN